MTIGTGIFLSAALLSVVVLFVATKDRWNWGRIAKWLIGAPVLLIGVLLAGIWANNLYESLPRRQTEFWGLTLSATEADVKFLKGEPTEVIDGDLWVYYEHDSTAGKNVSAYAIRWRDGRPRYIKYATSKSQYIHPSMQGFSVGAGYDEVIKKLGEPAHTSTSGDGRQRITSFPEYQTFYEFEKGQLQSYGIYNTSMGPVAFADPAASAPVTATPR